MSWINALIVQHSYIGDAHENIPVDKLVTILTEMNEVKSKVTDKEKKLERLFKLTSKTISDYDVETANMVQRLDTAFKTKVRNSKNKFLTHHCLPSSNEIPFFICLKVF